MAKITPLFGEHLVIDSGSAVLIVDPRGDKTEETRCDAVVSVGRSAHPTLHSPLSRCCSATEHRIRDSMQYNKHTCRRSEVLLKSASRF